MGWLDQLGAGVREDYILTVDSAHFAPDAAYQNGETMLLHLVGHDENGDQVIEKYNVGKEWTSYDGGLTIRANPDAKSKMINRTSVYGHMIQAAVESGAGPVLEQRGEPTNAQAWVGLTFHMKAKEISFGKKLNPITRTMPAEFHGTADATGFGTNPMLPGMSAAGSVALAVQTVPVPQAAVQAPVPAVAPLAPAPAAANGSGDLRASLAEVARQSPTFNDFLQVAFTVDGLVTDDQLLTEVTDESNFYAKARA